MNRALLPDSKALRQDARRDAPLRFDLLALPHVRVTATAEGVFESRRTLTTEQIANTPRLVMQAVVFDPDDLGRALLSGVAEVESAAPTVRALIEELDAQFPGLGRELRLTSAVAVDGDIVADNIRAASLKRIDQAETILFVPAVSGG